MTARPGPLNLITDIGGLGVGNAHDEHVETGVTVILPDERVVTGVAVGGGAPGTREMDALAPDTLVDAIDAIVFSGGSVYGLAAADGVTAALGARGRGFGLRTGPGIPLTPVVPGAILYDLANGGNKAWGENPPYRELGVRALDACGKVFPVGRAGAGFGARAGTERGGLGSASVMTGDGLEVGALAAVNAFGSVRMPGTEVFWAWPYEQSGEFGGLRPSEGWALDLDDWRGAKVDSGAASVGRGNTTLGCVATNVVLAPAEAQRVAKMAMAGLARAVRPALAPMDGDVVVCLSTAQVERAEPRPLLLARVGELAAACLARAIARGVYAAK